jgi:hypothetical protein
MKPARPDPDRGDDRDVLPLECTIPGDMTISEWREMLAARRRRAPKQPGTVAAAARRVVPLRPPSCDHLHATTTRYDHAERRLTFLLVCPVCGTEKVLETMHYEPRYEPTPVRRAA